jgi:hypothetical protein
MLNEATDSLVKANTPEPFSRSRTSNWVARTGGLPPYIQHVAHDLIEKRGKSESEAIQMAIGIVRNWASGQGKVDANTRAAAAKAVADFEAKRSAAKAGGAAKKLSESRRLATRGPSLADKVALRSAAKARLRAIEDAFGAQMMSMLMEAAAAQPAAWAPELKRTASGGSEIERHEVHDGGQHVGYISARPGYGPGNSRPTRYSAKAINGRMVSEMVDSKAKALDGLKKHLEEAPARVSAHRNGRFLVANPDSYSGPTTMTEYPSQSSARYAAGLPEQPTSVEQKAQVVALGEMVSFDVRTLDLLGELEDEWRPLLEQSGDGKDSEPDGDADDLPFSAGDRVNYQHPTAGRVKARVVKVTSRHVHVSSPDPRVAPARMTHREAKSKLSVTSKALREGLLGSLLDSEGLRESALRAKERKALPDSAFVYPDKREYPIDTRARAIAALARAADPANKGALSTVQAAVYAKYPDLKPAKGK